MIKEKREREERERFERMRREEERMLQAKREQQKKENEAKLKAAKEEEERRIKKAEQKVIHDLYEIFNENFEEGKIRYCNLLPTAISPEKSELSILYDNYIINADTKNVSLKIYYLL